jgi:hypothetical protein
MDVADDAYDAEIDAAHFQVDLNPRPGDTAQGRSRQEAAAMPAHICQGAGFHASIGQHAHVGSALTGKALEPAMLAATAGDGNLL